MIKALYSLFWIMTIANGVCWRDGLFGDSSFRYTSRNKKLYQGPFTTYLLFVFCYCAKHIVGTQIITDVEVLLG